MGNDSLLGEAGDDKLRGGSGNDTLDGGTGLDTADYSTENAGVTVNLGTNTATDGSSNTDTLVSIENIAGGSGVEPVKKERGGFMEKVLRDTVI